MNSNEKTKIILPEKRAALLRLAKITLVLFPISWVVFALLVGSWNLEMPSTQEEPLRHIREWLLILAAAIAICFLASLLPLSQRLRWIYGWLFTRRALIVLAWLVTLGVLFYAEEDWRGAHAWNQCEKQLQAAGMQLDFAAFIPKTISDDQNFAATPFVQSWFTRKVSMNAGGGYPFVELWKDNFSQINFPSASKVGERQFTDVVAWKNAFGKIQAGETNMVDATTSGQLDLPSRAAAAPAIFELLKTNEIALAQLREASARPLSRYPVNYTLDDPWGIWLPHLNNLKCAALRLQLRASAELAAGRSDDALADVKLILYLADSVKSDPFLISHAVRVACVQMAIQPVWEGLAGHAWTDAQLQELQRCFQQFQFLADIKPCCDAEFAVNLLTIDLIRKKGLGYMVELFGPGQPTSMDKKFANWGGGLIPGGWFNLEKVNYVQGQMLIEESFNDAPEKISPDKIKTSYDKFNHLFAGQNSFAKAFIHHNAMSAWMTPDLTALFCKSAATQVAADQAAIACALERFRLANGQFPETLDALAPQFISQLPKDVISGDAYKYHRTGGGQFILYSIGWDEKDDGGTPGKTLFDQKQGDWVWKN